ncbi:MAG TPA: efflux RND transporter periplasmic adaptor subunit [Candidatus Angelobacter sp.]|nr:efflux RND transporter periplasmic adaptor subunit [Candidatus Angelobacter sp.]
MNATNANTKYKTAFYVALAIIVALALFLAMQWHNAKTHPPAAAVQAESSASSSPVPLTTPVPETPLAPVQLTPERMQMIGVKLAKVEVQNVTDDVRASGNVEINERQVAYVQTRFPGWIRQVYANATYQFVRKGQPLFTIYSPELLTTEQEYLLAKKNAEAVKASTVSGVASGSQSLLEATLQRLQQWEVPASEIQKLESSGKVITDLTFISPVSGFITERNVLPNMYVQPETRLYTVADLSTVWVSANVFQNDLGRLKPGYPAAITVDTYPGKVFTGQVSEVLPQVDMNTRTARVRIVLSNPGLKLMPGMYVNVGFKVPLGRQLVVPSSAVLRAGMRQVVFVSRGEGNFEPRDVEALEHGDKAIIAKGLKPGETVVSSANFLIDSESQLQAAAGAFVPPPPGAGAAASMNQNAQEAVMEFSTQPDPPHKGDNIFRVKLATKNAVPISGAQVSVTFFMPAMPAMGMAAMKTNVDLADRGGGLYEGKASLGSGGSWQVTLTAKQNGRTIGSKHFTVNAEGGM